MATSKDIGKGRIIIPSDVDRDKYIRRCYDTGRVSIFSNGAGVIEQAAVALHCINDLIFPLTAVEFGSDVAYMKIANSEEYIIMAVFKEIADINDVTEHQYSIGRHTDDGISTIAGDADEGSLIVTVNHNKLGGMLTIGVGNSKTGGKMVVNVSTAINTDSKELNISTYEKFSVTLPKGKSGDVTSIQYIKGKGFSYSDEFGNAEDITSDSHKINHKKQVIFGDDKYSAVLYEELESFLNDLIQEIAKITTVTALGTMPIVNIAQVSEFIVRLKELKMKSTYVKLK